MSEAKIKVRIIRPLQNRGEGRMHELKRGSSIPASPDQCVSCEERKRGHGGGEERRSVKEGKEKIESYQKEQAVLYVSDIARSIQESLRLRKTLRV